MAFFLNLGSECEKQFETKKQILSAKGSFFPSDLCVGDVHVGVRRNNCSCLVVWGEACDALFERTSVLKLFPQEGNLSRAGCFGMLHTTAEIIDSDSACNYRWRTLDAGRRPLILLLALDALTRQNSRCHPHNTVCVLWGENVPQNGPKPHQRSIVDAVIHVIRLT